MTDLQENVNLYFVYLGRGSSQSSACGNINERFRLDDITLKAATAIYRENDDSLGRILFASSGYYSDGDIVRYWTGTEFTTINRCSEYS